MRRPICCLRKPLCAGVLAILAAQAWAQGPLPATIYVPVVFYDYHANGTNPNFEPTTFTDDATQAGLRTGMVQTGLSADRKPRLQALRAFNDSIEFWFRPSGAPTAQFQENAGAGRWEWTNLVNYSGRADEWCGASFVASQPMANVVIYERLPFTLVSAASGTYELRDDTFFPLDNRGFGAEPATYARYNWTNTDNNNFCFAMELHHRFTFRNGLTFHFTGDDDVWAFIDGRLVMDLGGIHGALTDSVILDNDVTGLVVGQSYFFDFFYCERHVTQSHIWVQTNLVAPITVDSLHMVAQPAVTRIPAGDSVVYSVVVYLDSAGVKLIKPAYNDLVQWSVSGDANNPGMSDNQGATSTFYGHRAWVTYTVTATLQDPVTGQLYTKTMTVTVDPGPPTHVVIEPDSVPDKWTPDPVNRLTMPIGVDRDSVYAVLRDKYENLVSLGAAVSWNSMNTVIASVAATSKPYEGQILRGIIVGSSDSVRIIASQGALIPDTAWVVLMNTQKVAPVIASPAASTPGGTYTFTGSVTVTLTTETPGATIWYCIYTPANPTVCAGPPVPGSATQYTAPIQISATDTTIIRAIASKTGYENSDPAAYRYANDRDVTGPTITHAYFYLGNPPGYNGPRRPDTLLVVFDEPVRPGDITSLAGIFDYADDAGRTDQDVFPAGTQFELVYAAGDSLVSQVRIIYPSGTDIITPDADRIRIQNGTLQDVWGNRAQDSPERTVEWGRAYDIVIAVSQNPVRPGSSTINWSALGITPQRVTQSASAAPNYGTVLKVSSVHPIDPAKTTMTIYDALGNIVRNDFVALTAGAGQPTSQCYFIWDIANRNNRLVGSGTYLAVLNVRESVTNETSVSKQKIGVMR